MAASTARQRSAGSGRHPAGLGRGKPQPRHPKQRAGQVRPHCEEGTTVTEEQGPEADRTADALAYVCARLDWLRSLPLGNGPTAQSPLQQLLDAVRRGQDVSAHLDALHTAVQSAGDALGVRGARGHARRGEGSGLNLAGIDGRAPFEHLYLCPADRCSGRRPDRTTVFPLICGITGERLRRERL
jgi:hypothetical protein